MHLAAELARSGAAVRVVSRSKARLALAFKGLETEQVAADMSNAEDARRAIEGCDVVFDCIGLPADRFADHPRTARQIAAALAPTGARAVHVSSYWAYLPLRRSPVDETHPREGGNAYMRGRREAEDILRDVGAAVVNLPDFYGPQVHSSSLQQALGEMAAGKTVNGIGSPDTAREYIYVPDAMKAVAALAGHEQAYGKHWVVPGAGPVSLARIARIAGDHLGTQVRVRSAGRLVLRLVSLFSRPLREFMPMVPTYLQPIAYDGSKLRLLLGQVPVTPYEEGVPQTLDWLLRRNPA
jgi:nucleoside-diphosphate-sugar epimerase